MNNSALRLFVRSIIAEAKEAKETKDKKEPKKSIKKEEKAPKSDGKLIDLKKELAALEQYKDELQAAKFAEKTASTEVEFADLAHFAKELAALKERGVELEKEVDDKIAELKTKISDEKNKIKEMMGLVPEGGKKKMVDEAKPKKEANKPVRVTPDNTPPADKDLSSSGWGMSEARFKKGTDIGKKGKGFEKIEKSAAKRYGSEEAGKKVAGAILKKVVKK